MNSTPFGLLKITGETAQKFLQGQVTCDMQNVTTSKSQLGAHCNPQGRIIFLFRVFQFQNDYYLVMPRTMIDIALNSLKKYAVFFKINLSNDSDNPGEQQKQASKEWQFFDIEQGVAQVYPETSGKFLPHELNLHLLDGISWEKGCYTGQEIIARMHYRGKLKNKLFKAQIETSAPIERGMLLTPPEATIVDYQEQGYNKYLALILTQENSLALNNLKVDPSQTESWTWL